MSTEVEFTDEFGTGWAILPSDEQEKVRSRMELVAAISERRLDSPTRPG